MGGVRVCMAMVAFRCGCMRGRMELFCGFSITLMFYYLHKDAAFCEVCIALVGVLLLWMCVFVEGRSALFCVRCVGGTSGTLGDGLAEVLSRMFFSFDALAVAECLPLPFCPPSVRMLFA